MNDATPFPARLRQLREAAGLTQQQLADRVGADRVSVARWEGGTRAPSWETVRTLAQALGVGVESFDAPRKLPRKK